jgi:hypothetical protein
MTTRYIAGPWKDGETERWQAWIGDADPGWWHLGRFVRDNDDPVEELHPLNVKDPSQEEVVGYLSQRLGLEEARACYELWQADRKKRSRRE